MHTKQNPAPTFHTFKHLFFLEFYFHFNLKIVKKKKKKQCNVQYTVPKAMNWSFDKVELNEAQQTFSPPLFSSRP